MKKIRFGLDSKQDLPPKINNSYHAWDLYMGHVWYNLIFFLDIEPNSTVIEVAPGTSIKIPVALSKLSFCGQLYVVEPNKSLKDKIYEQYKNYLPAATIIIIEECLENALQQLPLSPDAILANHPLDDMLLAFQEIQPVPLIKWNYPVYSSHAMDQTRNIWISLTKEPNQLTLCCEKVINVWKKTYAHLQPKKLLLSQYPSFTLKEQGLNDLNQKSMELLHRLRLYVKNAIPISIIQKILNSMKHYNHEHIGNHVLNAENWLISIL